MKPETGYFSSFDQTKLFYRLWLKETPATLLIVHGFGEHSGRYSALAHALSELPVSVIAYDLRGHGESEGARVYSERFEDFIKDLYRFKTFFERKQKNQTEHRIILLGQSLGGLIASSAALEDQRAWQGLILLSPFFGLPRWEWLLKKLTYFLDLFAGKLIWANPIPPVFLTHDREAILHYRSDPLIQRRITIHMAHEMFRAAEAIFQRAGELTLPLSVLAAGNDKIVCLEKIKKFFETAPSPKKQMKIFDGFYHELLHERGREQAFRALKECLRDLI